MIVDEVDYLDKMENLLNDTQKSEKFNLRNDEILNFTVKQEKRVDNILKKLVASNSISEETKRFVTPDGTRPGIMYGLRKIKFTKISSIIARLFYLFCQQLILLPIN